MRNPKKSSTPINSNSNRKVLLKLSFSSWLISLALPALITPNSEHTSFGIGILVMGWLGIAGVEDGVNLLGVLAWWANPVYLWAITKASSNKTQPIFSAYLATGLGALTFLLSSYAINSVPSFAPIIGYGPGALLWFLALLGLSYVVAMDTGNFVLARLYKGIAIFLIVSYVALIGWRAISSNESERERLPYYSAKRGFICSVEATQLPIIENQTAISLIANDNKHWIESLHNWGITTIQIGSMEYTPAEENSIESRTPPYMLLGTTSHPARYAIEIEGGYPFINKWSDGGDIVRLRLIDTQNNKELGQLSYHKELSSRLGFCPKLTMYSENGNEEAIRWLAPFIQKK